MVIYISGFSIDFKSDAPDIIKSNISTASELVSVVLCMNYLIIYFKVPPEHSTFSSKVCTTSSTIG